MNDNNKERICKNCKYHYIEEISFDYPQSCCSKRQITTEEWLKCNDFEYDDKYIEQLQKENKILKENYERIYNENCILREKHNINDIDLLDENTKLKEVIDKLEKYIEKETRIYGLSMSIELGTHFDNILGILKEVE